MRYVPLILALVVGGVWAQEAPEPGFDLIGDVAQKVTYNAADWDKLAGSNWTFNADLRPRFTYGAVSFQADSTWTLPITANLASVPPTVSISEAYFRITPADGLDLTFGQKRFALGVGQTFTVGDSLNPVIGFFDQKTGFRGATAEWSPVSWASVSGALSTEGKTADQLAGAAQVSLLLDEWQLTASTVARKNQSFNPAVGLSYDLLGVIITAEGAAEFLPQGVRPDGLASNWEAPDHWLHPALSASTGARWAVTFGDWDMTLSGEYLHWAQGWNKDETDDWKAALATAAAPLAVAARKTLPLRSQENAFFRLIFSTGGVFSVSGFAAVDLQDQSVLGQATVAWTPWDNVDLTANLQAAGGDTGSAWESLMPNKDRYQASFSTKYHF